jgi:hypothetical protein
MIFKCGSVQLSRDEMKESGRAKPSELAGIYTRSDDDLQHLELLDGIV